MLVLVERRGPVAIVTLNRPEAMNALSAALRIELANAFVELNADEAIRAIVLTGAGQKAFTAGLDLKELGAGASVVASANPTSAEKDPVQALALCRKPIIGAINGVAITGGFEMALGCDVIYASTNARFADTHTRIGIMPGWGLSQKLSRVVGAYRAKELSLSGNFLDAETACAWGLVNRVFAPDELLPAAIKLAEDMASAPPHMVQAYKRLIDEGFAMNFGDGLAHETATSTPLNAAVSSAAVEQARAGVMARGRDQQ